MVSTSSFLSCSQRWLRCDNIIYRINIYRGLNFNEGYEGWLNFNEGYEGWLSYEGWRIHYLINCHLNIIFEWVDATRRHLRFGYRYHLR